MAPAVAAPTNVAVTVDAPYVKANGRAITATDAISACGDNRRQQNEPTSAVDPRKPNIITSGSNDYCTVELAGGTWAGFYRSTTSGKSWKDSLLPGYPTDESPEGLASPLHQAGITNAGDPVQAWDNHGRLFYMGNAFNRFQPQNGSVWVATYDRDASHYVRTRIVARGTPGAAGIFNDKTAIEVDRGAHSPYEGNVYAAVSVFQGLGGNNEIKVVRSTDHGRTFSHPMKISTGSKGVQFADIAVTSNGTVYLAYRQFETNRGHQEDAVAIVRSTDGGRTFSKVRLVTGFESFDAADFAGDPEAAEEAHEQAYENADGPESEAGEESVGDSRDCGSGPFACLSGYVFFRHDSQVRITADPKAADQSVYIVYDAIVPGSERAATRTYNTAPPAADGSLRVGKGAIYFTKSSNGSSWTTPKRLAPSKRGHQFFADINADGGQLHAVWHDSRNDPAYSVQRPPGNTSTRDAGGFATHTAGLDTYGATSTNGGTSWGFVRLSSRSQKPNYEMFGDRRVPFHGDYNYVSSVGSFAYSVWTDTRQVRPGDDPRYVGGETFDVYQCRTIDPATGDYGADTCPNAGGLDQDIFGAATTG